MAKLLGKDPSSVDRNEYIAKPDEKILITGANGYIGSRVVEILAAYGFMKLRCLVRSDRNLSYLQRLANSSKAEIEILRGNLLSFLDCGRAAEEVAIVYHLAAGVEKSFPGCFLNSAVATKNLLEALIAGHTLKRLVNISSIAVYDNEKMPRGGLVDESCEMDTKFVERWEAYTYGKARQDEVVQEYGKSHQLPFVIVRPGVVFGPGKAKISERIGTSTFGIFLHLGLNNTIPLTYVDNCAEAIVLAGLKRNIEGEIFNIVDDDLPKSRYFLKLYKRKVRRFHSIPVPYPIWYLFCYIWEKYSKWSGGQLPPVFNRKKCSVYWRGNRYSNRKAKELLKWKPRVNMKEALKRYFDYMREIELEKND